MTVAGLAVRVPGITVEMRKVLKALLTDTVSELGMEGRRYKNTLKKLEIMGLVENGRVKRMKVYEIVNMPEKLESSVDYQDAPPSEWTLGGWCRCFRRIYLMKFGRKYRWSNSDWWVVEKLLRRYSPDKLRELIRAYFWEYEKFTDKPTWENLYLNREKIYMPKVNMEFSIEI